MNDASALERELVPPPGEAPDVCPVCRSWRAPEEPTCENCSENQHSLGLSAPVIPISLYRKPSLLRDWLTYYKPSREAYHPEYGIMLGGILHEWSNAHATALQEWCGGIDTVCVVPSANRDPPHPLEAVLDTHAATFASKRASVLVRGDGGLAHRTPSQDGYVATVELHDQRVLLLDDVYTTGARGQSAAFALHAAGAHVPALLVVARRLNPEWRAEVAELWDRQARLRFQFAEHPWWRGPH